MVILRGDHGTTPGILVLRSQWKEDPELESSLAYMVKPYVKTNYFKLMRSTMKTII